MPTNPEVKILKRKDRHRFSISPFEPKPEPANLAILKQE
jgi:hypothetical protein